MNIIWNCSVLIILLLYEEIAAAPRPDWNSVIRDKPGEDELQSQVPVWARKAGFRVKQRVTSPASLSDIIPGEENDGNSETKKPDGIIKETEIRFSSPDLLSATHVDGEIGMMQNTRSDSKIQSLTSEILPENYPAKQRQNKNDGISQEKEDPEESRGYEYDDEEPECPETQFWHIRGQRCVPIVCPGGNNWRDDDGNCILRHRRRGGRKYSKKFGIPSRTVTGLGNGHWVSG